MSRPEPMDQSSLDLDESLALVRKILAEGAPPAKPMPPPRPPEGTAAPARSASPGPLAGGPGAFSPRDTSTTAAGPSGTKAPPPGGLVAAQAPTPGRLSDALRNVAPGPAWPEQRIGMVAGLDDDLADLVDLGPAPSLPAAKSEAPSATPPHPAPAAAAPSAAAVVFGGEKRPAGLEARELPAMEGKGRARIAPSVDPELRAARPAVGAATVADKAMPEHALKGPSSAGRPAPQRSDDRWPSLELPQAAAQPQSAPAGAGPAPAARLPQLDSSSGPATATPEPVLPMPSDWRGWPRSAARAPASDDGAISAPPTAPVVIASMPSGDVLKAAAAASAAAIAPAPAAEAKSRDAETAAQQAPCDGAPHEAAIAEHLADHRFEVIASMGPALRPLPRVPAPATPEAASAPAQGANPTGDGVGASSASRSSEPQPAAAPGAAEGTAETSEGADEIVVAAAAAAALAATTPAEQSTASSVKDVASALDRLVADLAAAAQPQTAPDATDPAQAGDVEEGGSPEEYVAAPASSSAGEADQHEDMRAEDTAIEQVAEQPADERDVAEAAAVPEADDHGANGRPSSVVSSADAFISGVHAPGEPPRTGMEAGSDAMLKLVGTSLSVARHGMDVGAEQPFDDTVADLLRPMIREWLDANMPRILEKAVRKEMAERPASRAGKPNSEG